MNFKSYLQSRKDINLSQSQTEVVNKISTFLEDKKGPQCFILRGSAGSGKTFIGSLLKEYDASGTMIFTPTGRAAKIFRSMVRDFESRRHISTIHHGIYTHSKREDKYLDGMAKSPENLQSSKEIFGIRDNLNSDNAVYICDESSMISDASNSNGALQFGTGKLLSDLFTHIGNRKILFIGDHAQLTPINMDYSPALSKDYIEEHFNIKVIDFELKEVMRQEHGSGILKNATQIRNNIFGGLAESNDINSEDDISYINTDKVLEISKEVFDPKSFSTFTVVTHTRKLSQKYNFAIRDNLFPNERLKFVEGERLMCANTNYKYGIFNGELLKVSKVFNGPEDRIEKLLKISPTFSERKYSSIPVQSDGKMHIWLCFQRLKLEYYDSLGKKENTECFVLENSIDSSELTMDRAESRALLIDFLMRYKKTKDKYMTDRKKNYLSPYEEELAVKNGEILDRSKDELYNALITKYGYALTAHKAQGGEWENAIIDLDTSFFDNYSEEYARWLYTSITRAKKHLYLVN